MRVRLAASLALLTLVPCLAHAGVVNPQEKARPEAVAADVQDVVYLGDVRPVFLRLHIQRDGKPYDEAWTAYLKELYRFLDRDGDGVLSKEEAARVPSGPQLLQQFRGYFLYAQGPAVKFEELDTNQDGKVTLDEVAAYYRRSGAGPLQMNITQGNSVYTDALTNALFKYLDTNKDGKLTKEKLARAETLLAQFDADDDEMLCGQELAGNINYGNPYQLASSAVSYFPQQQPANTQFFLVDATNAEKFQATRLRLVQQLLAKYDRDKNHKLTRAEIGLDRETFKRLDTNNDRQLDMAELMKLLQGPPDLELVVRLGKTATPARQLDLVIAKGQTVPLASAVTRGDSARLDITLADARMNVRRASAMGNIQATLKSYRQFYVNQFKAADTNKDGCVDMNEAQKSQYRFYLQPLVQLADRNGDGKLNEKELNDYLDLLDKGVGCSTYLTITNNGRGLFAILDGNGDGQLGLRELRTAWNRLTPYDRAKKGHVLRTDIPLQIDINVGISQLGNVYTGFNPYGMAQPARRPSTKGPLWFRKMDRNGDGDVSWREFLGTREDFKRIDADGDGLIDAEEATRADTWFRKRLQARN